MLRFKKIDGSEYKVPINTPLVSVTEFIRNGYSYVADGKRTHKFKLTRIETISSGEINIEKLGSSETIDKKYLLKEGDILYSHINSLQYLGNTAQYHSSQGEIYHGMNLLCVRPNTKKINAGYLKLIFQTQRAKKFVTINAKLAVHQASIPSSDLGRMVIPLPCLEEQQKIADCISSVDDVISDYEGQVERMQNQKKGVMQKLFSQEVRFKPDNGEMYPKWNNQILENIGDFYGGVVWQN